jgi:hypothetical protein
VEFSDGLKSVAFIIHNSCEHIIKYNIIQFIHSVDLYIIDIIFMTLRRNMAIFSFSLFPIDPSCIKTCILKQLL